MSENNQTLLDLDSELEDSVDGTEAAPDFLDPPTGKYVIGVVSAKMKQKTVNNPEDGADETRTTVNIVYKVVKTEEVVAGEVQVEDGSMFSERFQWTEQGKSYLKARCSKILGSEAIKGAKWKDILAALPDAPSFPATIRWETTTVKGKPYKNLRLAIQKAPANPA